MKSGTASNNIFFFINKVGRTLGLLQNLLLMTSDTFLFKFCMATKSHLLMVWYVLLGFLFCLFGFSLGLILLLNYSLYFMDKLCLWTGFLVDDVSHVVCYYFIISDQ